jgi:hypothetical protein
MKFICLNINKENCYYCGKGITIDDICEHNFFRCIDFYLETAFYYRFCKECGKEKRYDRVFRAVLADKMLQARKEEAK